MNLSSKVGALKQNTKSTKHSKELRKCWRKINDKKARSLKNVNIPITLPYEKGENDMRVMVFPKP